MKLRRLIASLAVITAVFWCFYAPSTVYAESKADEAAIATVSDELSELWRYADMSAATPDETFYPQFAERAGQTAKALGKAHDELAKTEETGKTKEVISRLLEDIVVMQDLVTAWGNAADVGDSNAFEAVSYSLDEAVQLYNKDIEAYDDAVYGTKVLIDVVLYAGLSAVSITLSAWLFAWAVLKNHRQETDAGAEALRKLRWYAAAVSLLAPIGIAPMFYQYFFTEHRPMVWLWVVPAISIAVVVALAVRYLQVRALVKKLSKTATHA